VSIRSQLISDYQCSWLTCNDSRVDCRGAHVRIGRVHVSSPQFTRFRQTSDRTVHDELSSAFRVGFLQTNSCEVIKTQQVWFRFSQKAVPQNRAYVTIYMFKHYTSVDICIYQTSAFRVWLSQVCPWNNVFTWDLSNEIGLKRELWIYLTLNLSYMKWFKG